MTKVEFVKNTIYGNKKAAKADCILISPHDGEWGMFLDLYPELLEACPASRETLETFLKIEEDFGANEIAHETAKIMAKNKDLRIDVIEIVIPRAIIDGNRITEKCIRNIFPKEAYPDLVESFKNLHAGVIQIVLTLLKNLDRDGVIMDIHTMSPYNPNNSTQETPTEAISEQPYNLPEYIEAYMNRKMRGERRDIDILTEMPDGEVIIPPKFSETLIENFDKYHLKYKMNSPYSFSEWIMCAIYIRKNDGLVIDIPKDLITKYDAEDAKFDLANLILDEKKIHKMGSAIAKTLISYLEYKRG